MKRIPLVTLLCALSLTTLISVSDAQRRAAHASPVSAGKIDVPCPATLADTTECPDTGCGNLDPHLNQQKNTRSLEGDAEPMTIQQMRNLPDPVQGFAIGDTREAIKALGEGKKIVVVANALVARKGGAESCNCKLTSVADTDNHIVLVDRVLRIKPGEAAKDTLSRREENSETAEFAPRPRLDHPNLTRANLMPLIAVDGVQKIRVTGILMFDSEHSLGRHLKRHNNWEVHPVLDMDYCPRGKRCTADSDANWAKLGEQP